MLSKNISSIKDLELSYLLGGKLRKDHQPRISWMKYYFKFHCQKNHLTCPKVLDFGCHDGTILKMIVGKSDAEISGLDHSPELVKKAKARKIRAKTASLDYHLPFESSSKEIIIAGEVLEHLYNPELALQEAHRILIENGGLIVTIPNICSLRNRFKILLGKFPMHYNSSANGIWGEHIRLFNSNSLNKLLYNSGFKIKFITSNGVFGSGWFTQTFPSLGDILIIYAVKNKNYYGGKNEPL